MLIYPLRPPWSIIRYQVRHFQYTRSLHVLGKTYHSTKTALIKFLTGHLTALNITFIKQFANKEAYKLQFRHALPRICKLSALKLKVVSKCCCRRPGVQITMFVCSIRSRSSFRNYKHHIWFPFLHGLTQFLLLSNSNYTQRLLLRSFVWSQKKFVRINDWLFYKPNKICCIHFKAGRQQHGCWRPFPLDTVQIYAVT